MSAPAAAGGIDALLQVDGLAVAYDGMRALQEVSLHAEAGTIVDALRRRRGTATATPA